MATDYDTPRKTDEELHEESLEELKAKRVDAQSGQIDVDEAEAAENLELPGADLSGAPSSAAATWGRLWPMASSVPEQLPRR